MMQEVVAASLQGIEKDIRHVPDRGAKREFLAQIRETRDEMARKIQMEFKYVLD
jgi:hypothetical protein